jgi:hypothetical protein
VIRSGRASALPRRLVVLAAAALLPVLAGCEAGTNAPSQDFHYPTDTAGTVVGKMSILNVFVLGAPLGSTLAKGQNASLFMNLVNLGPSDRLLSVTAPGVASSVTLPPGGVLVPSGKPNFSLSGPHALAYLTDLITTLRSGPDITLVLDFQKLGPITLHVPVMPKATHFTTYAPAPKASHSPKPGKSATPSPSPS